MVYKEQTEFDAAGHFVLNVVQRDTALSLFLDMLWLM